MLTMIADGLKCNQERKKFQSAAFQWIISDYATRIVFPQFRSYHTLQRVSQSYVFSELQVRTTSFAVLYSSEVLYTMLLHGTRKRRICVSRLINSFVREHATGGYLLNHMKGAISEITSACISRRVYGRSLCYKYQLSFILKSELITITKISHLDSLLMKDCMRGTRKWCIITNIN